MHGGKKELVSGVMSYFMQMDPPSSDDAQSQFLEYLDRFSIENAIGFPIQPIRPTPAELSGLQECYVAVSSEEIAFFWPSRDARLLSFPLSQLQSCERSRQTVSLRIKVGRKKQAIQFDMLGASVLCQMIDVYKNDLNRTLSAANRLSRLRSKRMTRLQLSKSREADASTDLREDPVLEELSPLKARTHSEPRMSVSDLISPVGEVEDLIGCRNESVGPYHSDRKEDDKTLTDKSTSQSSAQDDLADAIALLDSFALEKSTIGLEK